jgi:hypothetical protein
MKTYVCFCALIERKPSYIYRGEKCPTQEVVEKNETHILNRKRFLRRSYGFRDHCGNFMLCHLLT